MGVDTPGDRAAEALLLQFARAPRAGAVKTRMLPRLSAGEACALHRELVLWTCRTLLASGLGEVHLYVAGDTGDPLFAACRELGVAQVCPQRGADLGARMYHALDAGLGECQKVVLVGSDCPAISPAYLELALAGLEGADVVLGPAEDGGYVLLGARRITPGVFAGIGWGGDAVYARTLDNLAAEGLRCTALPTLWDVDRPEDLAAWESLRSCTI